MGQYHFDPETYLGRMRREVPGYEELQEALGDATRGLVVERFLDLGVGTGRTARAILARHPDARMVGVDASGGMIALAREELPEGRVERLLVADIREELPVGPFDLVVSALAVHHLTEYGKRSLFHRLHAVLRPGGRLVLGDVVVPDDPGRAYGRIDPAYDMPERPADLLAWMAECGFATWTAWHQDDLAVLVGDA